MQGTKVKEIIRNDFSQRVVHGSKYVGTSSVNLVNRLSHAIKRTCYIHLPHYYKIMRSKVKPFLNDISEYTKLIFINLYVQIRDFFDFIKVAAKYYSNYSFLKADLYLLLHYLFNNPYSISRRFLRAKGEHNIYAYGETPLPTMEMIAKQCRISSKDKVFELGCGRGRTSFWLHSFIKCRVVGVDFVPHFIKKANYVRKRYKIEDVEFRKENMIETDLTGATVIYLYGTCLNDEFIRKLAEKFAKLPAGTKIITVSYSLQEYSQPNVFEVMKRFPAKFTWGTADVYLNYKV